MDKIKTQRNKVSLVVDGYSLYCEKQAKNGRIYWTCQN